MSERTTPASLPPISKPTTARTGNPSPSTPQSHGRQSQTSNRMLSTEDATVRSQLGETRSLLSESGRQHPISFRSNGDSVLFNRSGQERLSHFTEYQTGSQVKSSPVPGQDLSLSVPLRLVARKLRTEENVMSWRLSEVMEDIGVTRELVKVRQTMWLQRESLWTIFGKLEGKAIKLFSVGSLLEGITTPELATAIDYVVCNEKIHVISDVISSVLGREEYLVHYLHTTPPGYCVLRPMREDAGIPVKDILKNKINEHNLVAGVVCLTHERLFQKGNAGKLVGHVIQRYDEEEDLMENVERSFYLPNLPKDLLNDWFQRTSNKRWPDSELREAIIRSDCVLVPVGHKKSRSPQVEFRFSLINAERYLMLDMNIVQIRCLILMKFLIRNNSQGQSILKDVITTYFLKTSLWYVKEETGNEGWDHDHLLSCTIRCLKWLRDRIDANFLPGYFLPAANLLEDQFDEESRTAVSRKLSAIILSPSDVISVIEFDDLGQRFLLKNSQMIPKVLNPPGEIKFDILNELVGYHMFQFLTKFNSVIYARMRNCDVDFNIKMMKEALAKCKKLTISRYDAMRHAVKLIIPILCSIQGCLLGAHNTNRNLAKALKAEEWLLLGNNSDMTSGRLKLASAYYSYGEYRRAEKVLQQIEDEYSAEYVMRVCGCRPQKRFPIPRGFFDGSVHYIDENILQLQCAYCVVFTRSEKPCVPTQFQSEMYRSSPKEIRRRKEGDFWMDWACVDSYPYLYFLQYLTFDALRDRKQSLIAFRILERQAEEENWYHAETVYNLLGQCYEKEGDGVKAFACYKRSSEIMPTNNAANTFKRRLRSKSNLT